MSIALSVTMNLQRGGTRVTVHRRPERQAAVAPVRIGTGSFGNRGGGVL